MGQRYLTWQWQVGQVTRLVEVLTQNPQPKGVDTAYACKKLVIKPRLEENFHGTELLTLIFVKTKGGVGGII